MFETPLFMLDLATDLVQSISGLIKIGQLTHQAHDSVY